MTIARLLPGGDFWSRLALVLQGRGVVRVFVPYSGHRRALEEWVGEEVAVTAFSELLESVEVAPPLSQEVLVAQQLRGFDDLRRRLGVEDEAALWDLSRYLVGLAQELSAALLPRSVGRLDFDRSVAGFLARLQPRLKAVLSEEAELIWRIWQSLVDEADPTLRRLQGLRLAASAYDEAGYCWVSARRLTAVEEYFLSLLPQPVLRVYADPGCDPLLQRALPALDAASSWLCGQVVEPVEAGGQGVLAFAEGEEGAGLAPRPLPPHFWQFADYRTEVAAALAQVERWQGEGKRVALVVLEPQLVKRLRHGLQRSGLALNDEVGMPLLEDHTVRWMLSLLRLAQADLHQLADSLHHGLLRGRVPTSWPGFYRHLLASGEGWQAALAKSGDGALKAFLTTLCFSPGVPALSVRGWGQEVLRFFATLGSRMGLDALEGRDNPALGRALTALERLPAGGEAISYEAFVIVLETLWGNERYYFEGGGDINLVNLSALRLRSFDAVWVAGASAAQLPGQRSSAGFFSPRLRHELGLSSEGERQKQNLLDFAALFCSGAEVVLSYAPTQAEEEAIPSPWALALAEIEAPPEHLLPPPPSAPVRQLQQGAVAYLSAVPTKLSASAWASLMACPFQFYARYGLKLKEPEVAEVPSKRDYGIWLHDILASYHGQPGPSLAQRAEAFFGRQEERWAEALAYKVRFEKNIAAYLEHDQAHSKEGWRCVAVEAGYEKVLALGNGQSVTLYGRIDRIDRLDHGSGNEYAVVDYKTEALTESRARLKRADDHQLAFYALLLQGSEPEAEITGFYLPLQPTSGFAMIPQVGERAAALESHIRSTLTAVAAGSPLPANGVSRVCRYCEVKGLCRRDFWSGAEAASAAA